MYKKISVIDNYQEDLWKEVETIGANGVKLLLFLLTNRTNGSEELLSQIPIYDEVIFDDGKYVITYTDGLCEALSLYETIK